MGRERTFSEDMVDEAALREALEGIIEAVWLRIENLGVSGRTVTLKVKYADFQQITRRKTREEFIAGRAEFASTARDLLDHLLPVPKGVRLLGLTLSGLGQPGPRWTDDPGRAKVSEQHAFDF